jgi:hypothetical protein
VTTEVATWISLARRQVNVVEYKHSFVTLDISPDRLNLRAISAAGDKLDSITITKSK